MLIYMLLNTITEKAYIGQTVNTLRDRHNDHLELARGGSSAPIHVALREWPEWAWLPVVLQNCYAESELDAAEDAWIELCQTRRGSVGYNLRRGGFAGRGDSEVDGRLAFRNKKAARHREDMTAEELEVYRQHGLRGTKRKADMTEAELEQCREWGRKGAGTKEPKPKRVSPLADMTPEQRRAYFSECGKRGAGKPKPRRQIASMV
jgi:hypothetical protein